MSWVLIAFFNIPTTAVVLEDVHVFEFLFKTEKDCERFIEDNRKGLEQVIKDEYKTFAKSFVCVDADRILDALTKWFKAVLTREYRVGHKYNYNNIYYNIFIKVIKIVSYFYVSVKFIFMLIIKLVCVKIRLG